MCSQAIELTDGVAKSEHLPPVHIGVLVQAIFWMQERWVDVVKHQQILNALGNFKQNPC